MSDKPDTVSSGPDSPIVEEPGTPPEGQMKQAGDTGGDLGLIERDAPTVTPTTDLLQTTSNMVQGMMASMGQPGGLIGSIAGDPAVQGSTTSMVQGAAVNPDGTVVGLVGDPSGDARSATSYDPTTNTITTTTVDPATGSITTTSTTVPYSAAGGDAGGASADSSDRA